VGTQEPTAVNTHTFRAFRAATGYTGPLPETAFGSDAATADELATLIAQGTKTATSSLHAAYQTEPLPAVGDYFVVVDNHGRATCIARVTDVRIRRYADIDSAHARAEGEGDRTLAAWRSAHEPFFNAACQEVGIPFDDDTHIVCETFTVVWRSTGSA
jgi:uncharacterized protein YhfF